jgi:DNA-binding MarR family transcriptional regulator
VKDMSAPRSRPTKTQEDYRTYRRNYYRKYRSENKEKWTTYLREYQNKNRDKIKESQRRRNKIKAVKNKIMIYLSEQEQAQTSDIISNLNVDPEIIIEALKELEKEGTIEKQFITLEDQNN